MNMRLLYAAKLSGVMTSLVFFSTMAAASGSATINFSYSGVYLGALSNGIGNFTIVTPNIDSVVTQGLSFNLSQSITGTGIFQGINASYSYTENDLDDFSFSFPNGTPTLSYSTNAVASTTSGALPASFSTTNSPPFAAGTVTLDSNSVFKAIMSNAVQPEIDENGTGIETNFIPNFDLTIAEAAALGNFTGFDWVQTVTSDPTRSVFLQSGEAPFNDPPGSAVGTSYCQSGECNSFPSRMMMYDQPENSCFSASGPCVGTQDLVSDPRDGTNFETVLVGLRNGQQVPLFGFMWASNYSGVGGEAYKYDNGIFDDGTGSGGVIILSETDFLNNTTTLTIPEPSTWAMMALGFAGLGFAAYRASRNSVALTA